MSDPEPPPLPLLSQLCDALSGPERRRLVFLCGSLDPDHSPVAARDVLQVLLCSGEQPWELLRELLLHLRRLDLLRSLFQCGREEVERQRSSLSKYRVLMVTLSEELTRDSLDQFKFLLGRRLPRDALDRATCFLDVVSELEKQGQESSDRVELIESCLRNIGRLDLARRVRSAAAPEPTPSQPQWCRPVQPLFSNSQQTRHMQLLHSAPEQRPSQMQRCSPFSIGQQTRHVQLVQSAPEQTSAQTQRCRQTPPLSTCQQTRHVQLLQSGAGLPPQILQREQSFSSSIDHYKLNTNPRGVCIIIDCVGHDGELMEQTFQSLGFSVELQCWLSVADCLSALGALQQSPLLRRASAFVCCVISRGTPLHLLATDAHSVGLHLDALRQMFTASRCPALAGKPKLFFIQRYSVQPEHQAATGRSYEYSSEDLETDGPGAGQYLLPTDADVFWSHCWTQESQLQKTGHHSPYLTALMGALQTGRLRKWHVVDLHLRVNAEVCEHNQRNPSEQYHLELRHTLTKNLYLH